MESVSSDSLEWALKHIEKFGDSDFFPLPFEYKAIRHCWDRIRDELLRVDLMEYRPTSPRRMAVPKPRGDFRIVSQLDPFDALLYTAMVYEAAPLVEAARAAPERFVACSYRIAPDADGALFVGKNGWPEFHAQSKTLAESGEFDFVLTADITDFYNQASQHRIRNALELAGVSDDRSNVIEHFLSALAAKHSRGLPVGPNASIVLAEACVIDVDGFLLGREVAHTRYVDDFRIFCKERSEAVRTLHDLSDYLYTAHRLTLNSSKTRILSCAEFLEREALDPEEEENRGRLEKTHELISVLTDLMGGYAVIEDADDLTDFDLKRVINENMGELFEHALASDRLNLGIARHLLRRAGSLRTTAIHNLVISNLSKLAPALRDVAIYLQKTKKATAARADELIRFLEDDDYGRLPFSRIWGLEVMNSIPGMLDSREAMRLAQSSRHSDILRPGDLRPVAAAACSGRIIDWIRERKENWSTYGPWDRRAIIHAAQALPRDERRAWLSIVERSDNSLDRAVAQYVRGMA